MTYVVGLGPPGAGKTYWAVWEQIVPALRERRKVITNVPLTVENIEKDIPWARDFLEVRLVERGKLRRFSKIEDYPEPETCWRHPATGQGPLLVIDEAHMDLPQRKPGVPQDIEEWFAMIRHQNVNAVLLTQHHRKVNQNIMVGAEDYYHFRKLRSIGLPTHYRMARSSSPAPSRSQFTDVQRKKYDKRKFEANYYPTHTLGGQGEEKGGYGGRPFWRSWPFYGLALLLSAFVAMLLMGGNPLKMLHGRKNPVSAPVASAAPPDPALVPRGKGRDAGVTPSPYPYGEPKAIFIAGVVRLPGRAFSYILDVLDVDGYRQTLTDRQLQAAGWSFVLRNECYAVLYNQKFGKREALCR